MRKLLTHTHTHTRTCTHTRTHTHTHTRTHTHMYAHTHMHTHTHTHTHTHMHAHTPFAETLERASKRKREMGLRRYMVLSIPCPREEALFSTGRVSRNRRTIKKTSRRASEREKRAGYWKLVKASCGARPFPQTEKAAPIKGPKRKPMENAIPITT